MSPELFYSAAALFAIAVLVPCLMVATTVLGPRSKGKIKNEAHVKQYLERRKTKNKLR